MSVLAPALLAAALHSTLSAAGAEALSVPEPVVAFVRVPTPWYAPRWLVERRMRATQAQYAKLPGLVFKAYSFEQASGDFGGVYWWRERAAAEAWFNPEWFARVKRERGVAGDVRLLAAPLTVDGQAGPAAASEAASAVVVWVSLPIPKGVSRQQLLAGFQAAVPRYQSIPGLIRKHFTIEDDSGRFGGVYLWRDAASCDAWFTAAWRDKAKKTYGAEPMVTRFDTPILLPVAASAP